MILSADPLHWTMAALTGAVWSGFTVRTLIRARRAGQVAATGPGGLLIGYASQSGSSEALARAAAVASPGARLLSLDQIGVADLAGTAQAQFYISTTGDGDAPDNATVFLARVMAGCPELGGLSYAILALGDRHYPRFCGFAHRLDHWLRACGATPRFPLTEVDRDQPTALATWRARMGETTNTGAPASAAAPGRWRLAARHHLNPGSPGGPLWHLVLEPEGPLPAWRAGDIAEITIPSPEGPVRRDYSLASLPASGRAELILREVISEDGRPGTGSHWLCRQLGEGGAIDLSIRANPGFHAGDDAMPMLLIGNGSGLAGLLAHLRHRAALKASGPVWLIYGERSPDHDAVFAEELSGYLASGGLARLDRSFSRGGGGPRYVQHILRDSAVAVRAHVAAGGGIWICGRREGMATDVQQALEEVLGKDETARLMTERRLRRDIY
ncbi:sulfite reductase subunit alpha [Pseudomonas sp. GX19020]|uniref:sulfite reductase subunit alpha n=1 Tax=Pseudomonas sp. GX19020 TaxID=2942277 RepID=UPI0020195815|nr:sulfite reductase subunit alpha [Pseudomonas sp. GX19020]MCL4068616.1 sulfite reductase subunit alpha [Pseudomonas sp. GX19020]